MYKDLFKLIWSGYDGIIFTYHLENISIVRKMPLQALLKLGKMLS